MIPKKYATYLNTKVGDKIMFRESTMHWFTNRIENAKKLVSGQVYTVKKISVASSSTGVILEETNEEVELTWFDVIEDMNTEIETINENYNITLTISNEVGDKLHEAKTNTNTIQDIGAMTGDNALMELYNNGLREIKKVNS
jgi:hypothetical protein